MSLIPFLTCTDRLDLVRVTDLLVQYIDHVLGFFICGLVMSLLALGAGSSLEHAKVAYLAFLLIEYRIVMRNKSSE